jgi:hypothetical protein
MQEHNGKNCLPLEIGARDSQHDRRMVTSEEFVCSSKP